MFEEVTGSYFELPKIVKLEEPEEQEVFYFVDFTKLTKVEDLVLVLQAMGFGLSSKHVHFESIKQFLDLDRPIKL